MLIEFSIENFRSIKDKVTFSLVASKTDHSLQNNLIFGDKAAQAGDRIKRNALGKGNNLLKCAVVYGANASGKTTVLEAMGYIKLIIIESLKNMAGDPIGFQPFKLDTEWFKKACTFDIDFIYEGIRYNYGASFTSEKVTKEYLYYYPKGVRSLIFDRDTERHPVFIPRVDKRQQNRIANETNDNVFYLANSSQRKYNKTSNVIMWFNRELKYLDRIDFPITMELVEGNLVSEAEIVNVLKKADLDISGFEVETQSIPYSSLPIEIQAQLNQDQQIQTQLNVDTNKTIQRKRLTTYHKGIDKDGNIIEVPFSLFEESAGTRKLFSLIGPWLDSIKTGSIIIIDELDSQMHPLLCEYLVRLFNNEEINVKNAQLIFSTHNTYLLNSKLFRRDQIWFTNKNPSTKNTELYSMLEFKQRKETDFENAYLNGKYEAIPYIEDLEGF